MFQNSRIASRLALGIAFLLLALGGVLLPAVLGQLNSVTRSAETRQLEDLQQTFQASVNESASQALMVVTTAVNIPGVTDAFARRDRAKLQALTLPAFQALKKTYNVKQFQFHTPPATSFLRLHDLKKYGDDLSSFRATVMQTNNRLHPQSGLENGVSGLGLRGVIPVYNQGQHIGSAEIGLSFGQDFFDNFTLSHNAPAALYLPATSGFTTFASTIPGNAVLNDTDLHAVLRGGELRTQLTLENKNWAVLAKPINDFSGQPLGVVEILIDRTEHTTYYRQTLTRILLIGLGALLAGLTLAQVFSRAITRPIEQLTQVAEEISRGKFNNEIQGTDRKDEIGALARAIERMAMSIKVAIERFKKG